MSGADASDMLLRFVRAVNSLAHDDLLATEEYAWFWERVEAGASFVLAESAVLPRTAWPVGYPLPRGVRWCGETRTWSFASIEALFDGLVKLLQMARHTQGGTHGHDGRLEEVRACLRKMDTVIAAWDVADTLLVGLSLD